MKNKELQEILLKHNPEAEIVMPAWNNHVETYTVVDGVFQAGYEEVENDFYGTPGRMDRRLFSQEIPEFLLMTSKFGRVENPEVDFGKEDTNYNIRGLNGPGGDPYLLWKMSGFTFIPSSGVWEWIGKTGRVEYNDSTQILKVTSEVGELSAKVIGVEDVISALRAMKIEDLVLRM